MASVFRQDTGEFLGYMAEPEGPLAGGITYWPFKAWLHSDGKLRSDPEPDSTVTDRVATEANGAGRTGFTNWGSVPRLLRADGGGS